MPTENLYTRDCIRTVSGNYVNVFSPDPDTITITYIAHSLSQQCRFGGHLPKPYYVAQHSYCASVMAEEGFKFDALMHDAAEAYVLDMPKPIKDRLPYYKELENDLMQVISKKFGFKWPMPKHLEHVDKKLLELEWKNVMIDGKTYLCWDMDQAKTNFLDRFYKLGKTK